MASGVTNIGKVKLLEMAFRNTYDTAAMDTSANKFFIALATSAVSLSATTLLFDTTTQIPDTAGYLDGGIGIDRNTSGSSTAPGWDTLVRDTTSNYGAVKMADVVFTASGTFPASGGGARYAILTNDDAAVGSRDVLAWFDLTTSRSIELGSTLTLQDIEVRIT